MIDIKKIQGIETPFYYYDKEVLWDTLKAIKKELDKHPDYHLHYAIKANANVSVLREIQEYGFGVDCVSGGEIHQALTAGFDAKKIVFAGVGKADWEITLALEAGIFCFNVESEPELQVINELAAKQGVVAKVCFRINPNVGAHTHANITTGLAENKFGISMQDMELAIREAQSLPNVEFIGLHFHIGSQILEMDDFVALSNRINGLQDRLESEGITVKNINVGGGLGISYTDPDGKTVPDFGRYFDTYAKNLKLRPGQQLHFELGRAVVGQMGTLITKVLYVKQCHVKQFCIVDGGMSDLIRPALYDAHHNIQNLSAEVRAQNGTIETMETYDVVGPICESSDVFGKDEKLPKCHRGDYVALRSAGAYGEIMACQYNCRRLPKGYLL